MMFKQMLYENLIPLWPVKRGKPRWMNLVTGILGIQAYGFLKRKKVGEYALQLDPGDLNDRNYYFEMVGAGYLLLMEQLLRRGDCVIDVGVNVGHFSASCALLVHSEGQVHSIEASPFMIKRLRQMIAEVANGPIRIYHSAVDKSTGLVNFNIATNTGWSSLRENATFETVDKVLVQAITLDDFVLRENIKKVRLLKLDIEGAETDALIGASNLLNSGLVDFILIEVDPFRLKAFGHTGKELASLISKNGYLPVCMIENDTIIPLSKDRLIPGSTNCDYLYAKEELYQSTGNLLQI